MFDIHALLAGLARRHPIFQSLHDLRTALAEEIRRVYPDATLHEEYAFGDDRRTRTDIFVILDDASFAIELLYRTRKDERHALKQHDAQDQARYDFLRSVAALERLRAERANMTGFAVLLTNDHLYWARGRDATFDAAFHLWEGRTIHGTLAWDEHASAGTTQDRERPLHLHGTYVARWHDFSRLHDAEGGTFRYLAIAAVGNDRASSQARFTMDDALWRIVGSGRGEPGAASADKYAAHADVHAERGG